MNKMHLWIKSVALVAFVTMLGIVHLVAQDVRGTLFKEADAAMAEAKKVHAEVLAPKAFSEGMEQYRRAEEDLKRGRNLDDIRKRLNAAVSYFKIANKATELAAVTFRSSFKARGDAISAGAPQYATDLWMKAEEKFRDAAETLERGDVNGAKRKSGEAETLFRQAELDAIKVNYLDDTRKLLAQAKQMKVDKKAGKTLRRAEQLLSQAEKELNENRYDTDLPRSLAREANYEARHAISLAETINNMEKSKQSFEDVLLAAEKPLKQIADPMEIPAEFDKGFDETTNAILALFNTLVDSTQRLAQELADYRTQVSNLKMRVAEMEKQLGSVEKEKSQLARRMEIQAENRKRFESVAKMFNREEARVFREGENVILRLHGLNFPVNRSTIEPQYFGLLTKVQQAINIFPECTISVHGHTDAYGSDERNLQLSIERAEAVRQYLLANMGLAPERIEAVGFGESQPIASNETEEGRTKNRRIDIVIKPKPLPGGTY